MVHVRPHLVHDLEQKVTISTRQDDDDRRGLRMEYWFVVSNIKSTTSKAELEY